MEELSPEQNYRFALIEAVNKLIQTRIDVGDRIVNLAMAGEFAEIDDIFHFFLIKSGAKIKKI